MRRQIANMMAASIITAIAAAGSYAEIGTVGSQGSIAHLLASPLVPSALAMASLGLGSGPEGFPNHTDILLYVLTFLLWWVIVDLIRAAWRRLRGAR